MELKHKKIAFIGDSITEGAGVSSEEKIYLNLLRERCGLDAAWNYGVCATRIAEQTKSFMDIADWDQKSFITRAKKMECEDPDVIVIFGGTNDFGHGDAPVGKMEDRDPHTFYGALHTLYTYLMDRYPGAVIVAMTPTHRANENDPCGDWPHDSGVCCGTLDRYVKAIREVADYYSIPLCDLYATSGMYPALAAHREHYCPDGLHPNDLGHEIIASRLEGLLRSL